MRLASAYADSARAKRTKGDFRGASSDSAEAFGVLPRLVIAFQHRAFAKLSKMDAQGAIKDYTEALTLDPKAAYAYTHRAIARQSIGDFVGAIADYEQAISVDGKYALAFNDLAWLLATATEPIVRDGKRAVALATKACELSNWKAPEFLDTLAAAYARNGDFEAAVEWQQKALGSRGMTASSQALERLWLYREHKPWPEK